MGIGFAIPVSLAQSVNAQINKDVEVKRGRHGVVRQSITRETAQAFALSRTDGVLVRSLERDGPAARAGIEVRDVLLEIGGKPTPDVPQLLARIAELRPGTNAKVRLLRAGKTLDVDVVVAKRPRAS
jgi:serine protease DegQ